MLFFPKLFGAQVTVVDPEWRTIEAGLVEVEEELRGQGRSVLRLQAAQPERDRLWTQSFGRHAIGYVNAFLELAEQVEERGLELDEIWVCSSEATQAGLSLAIAALGAECRLIGISPVISGEPGGGWSGDISDIANEAAEILGLDLRLDAADIDNRAGFDADDEGEVTAESLEAVRLLAAEDGLMLDPVYTGKAMAAMLRGLESDPPRGAAVFIHTGGLPATMSFRDELSELLDAGAAAS
jgi:D-cysteine desulfhydrase